MPNPVPTLPTFVDGQDFDTEEKLLVLNRAVQRVRDKFGAIVANDLSGNTLDPLGPIDVRSHLVSHVSETLRVINYEEDGRSLDTILRDATEPVVVYIPGHITASVDAPAILRDDCQVIGGGNGSNVRATTSGLRALFECTGGKRWAVRNLRIDGGRAHTPAWAHHGIYVSGVERVEGLVDAVHFGAPNLDGDLVNGLPGWAMYISDASDLKVLGCTVRFCSSGGFFMKGSSHVDISDVKIQRNKGHGIRVSGCEMIRIFGCRIQWNNGTNLHVSGSTFISIFGNDLESPSTDGLQTSLIGSKSNISLFDVTDASVCENFMLDRDAHTELAATLGQLSALYQVEVDALSSRLLVVGNFMNETSQSPVHGQVNKVGAVPVQNYVKDQNHLFGSGAWVSLKRGHGGWKPTGNPGGFSADVQWNEFTGENGFPRPDDDDLGSNYQPEFVGVGGGRRSGGRHGRVLGKQVNAWRYATYDAAKAAWTWTGSPANYVRIGMDELILTLGNRGGVLTPAVIGSGLANVENEIGAVQATFNIYQRAAGSIPGYPAGMLRVPGGIFAGGIQVFAESDWAPYWGVAASGWSGRETVAGGKRVKMNENVLIAHVAAASPYGYDIGVVTADIKRGPGFVVIWSGVTNTHRDQRPTWVTVHT